MTARSSRTRRSRSSLGGNTTVQEANYLTRFAKKVSTVHRGGQFSAQRIAQERALGNPKIDVLWNTVVTAILSEQGVRAVRLRSIDDGAERELAVEGAFIFIGFTPNRIKEHAKHDALGLFLTDELMETSIAGIFAVGDIRAQPVRQVTNTVADGTVAAIMAQEHIEEHDPPGDLGTLTHPARCRRTPR